MTTVAQAAETAEAWSLVRHLTDLLTGALGDAVTGVYGHGSLVMGDFAPERSDVDLYVALSRDPDESDVDVVAAAVGAVAARFPAYQDRIEVEAFSRHTLWAAEPEGRVLLRVSPGEPCHLLDVTRHRILGWSGARTSARALVGPPASGMFPEWPEAEVDEVVRGIVREWPTWVTEEDRVGFNAYVVLTVCRCWCHLRLHERLSKLRAALAYGGVSPDDAELTRWALRWWYRGGRDDEPGRRDEVRDFVARVCEELLD